MTEDNFTLTTFYASWNAMFFDVADIETPAIMASSRLSLRFGGAEEANDAMRVKGISSPPGSVPLSPFLAPVLLVECRKARLGGFPHQRRIRHRHCQDL